MIADIFLYFIFIAAAKSGYIWKYSVQFCSADGTVLWIHGFEPGANSALNWHVAADVIQRATNQDR